MPVAETFRVPNSSWIEEIGYEPGEDGDNLLITFNDGKQFRYFGVSQSIYRNFCLAPSKGKFFHSRIKDVYDFEEA